MLEFTSQIIAQIESGGNQYAIRFEPAWRYFSDAILSTVMKIHGCDKNTARMITSCSYGLFQIMGQTIYEQGFTGNIYKDYLPDIPTQENAFDRFILLRKINYTPDELCDPAKRLLFASIYNGPGQPSIYADKIAYILRSNGHEVA